MPTFHPDRPTLWLLPPPLDPAAARAIAVTHRLGHPLVAAILSRRGLIGSELSDWLHPTMERLYNPSELRMLDAAVTVVEEAIRSGRKMVIYLDYDTDGTTGGALLESYLSHRGADVSSFVPMRAEGYGLRRESIARIADERRPELLLTVDCGTSSRAEADYARTRGMEVVVTDHHRPVPGFETAGIVVNPHIAGDTSRNKSLAGVGVAYKLVAALHGRHPIAFTDLVALGTIADVMSLSGENRILVREGLARLGHTRRPGLEALLRTVTKPVLCEHGSGKDQCFEVTAEMVGYQISPRINAIGRVGLDPALVVELFNTRDLARATEIAATLDGANKDRREQTERLTIEASALVEPDEPVIVVQLDVFRGYAGLIAGRLAEQFARPAIVIDPTGHGSARSVEGIDLQHILEAEFGSLVTARGHAMAMGIADLRDPVALRAALTARSWPALRPIGELSIDAVCSLSALDESLMEALTLLEPTGADNAPPLLLVPGVKVENLRQIGKEGRHAKMRLRDGEGTSRGAIWFNVPEGALSEGSRLDVAGRPSSNEFMGSRSVELMVTAVRPAVPGLRPTLDMGT